MSEIVTEFKLSWYDSPAAGRVAVVTMDNGEDHRRPNTFGRGALESLRSTLDEVERQSDVKGLLLTGKPFVFAVGADLRTFADATPGFARGASRSGQEAFGRLMALPFPTLAAINGACMGGGLEIALHCDYRTLSTGAAALAFPEVFLSILPAWGGTQLTPRIIGGPNALQAIIANALNNNATLKPREAFELGFADRLFDPVDFFERSLRVLEGVVTSEETIERATPRVDDAALDEALDNARQLANGRVHGATRAPSVAIDLIEHAARGGDLGEGLRREQDALGELLPSRQAQASVYAFTLTQQRVKRQPWKPDAEVRDIRKISVVGAGLMGRQLGSLFLRRFEVPLVMKDIDEGVLARARESIAADLDKRVQGGRMSEGKARFLKSIVTCTTETEPVAGSDLVIEAVVEALEVKQRIFADVEAVVDDGCILASNTSALSVTDMAADLRHPERLVGLHFFNPVAVLPLVEVVRAEQSSDEALATAFAITRRLRKSAVQCADTPAFVVNRILTRFMAACGEAVNQGNDFAEVDEAVRELGLPMGPFELLGLVGLRVAAHVGETMHSAHPDRFPLDANFRMLGETGLPGVYDWAASTSDRPVPYREIAERWQRAGEAKLTGEEIRSVAIEATADEIRHMLGEGVVADARDIDTCMLLGAGWPFFMGGICKYLDQTGVSEKLFGEPLIGEVDQAFADS